MHSHARTCQQENRAVKQPPIPTPIQSDQPAGDGLLARADLLQLLRLSDQGLDRLRKKDPTFPQPAKLGHRTLRWKKADITAWLEGKFATANSTADNHAALPANKRCEDESSSAPRQRPCAYRGVMGKPEATTARQRKHLVEAALDYAARGWSVIPLHQVIREGCSCGKPSCDRSRGKHPRTDHGVTDASTDPATIRGWWREWPSANVGIACGPASGLWMLGPDGEAGLAALKRLEQEKGKLRKRRPSRPEAVEAARHHLFAWPAAGESATAPNHRSLPIDTRGEGGLFVAPAQPAQERSVLRVAFRTGRNASRGPGLADRSGRTPL